MAGGSRQAGAVPLSLARGHTDGTRGYGATWRACAAPLTVRFALTAARASPARSEFYVDRPDVAQLRARGDAYVRAEFPKLSYISCAAAAQFSAQFSAQFLGAIL